MSIDTSYLRRIDALQKPQDLLHEPQFLAAQDLLFEVIDQLNGSVDFDIADMRETHIVAALGDQISGRRILDVGCGSPEPYVLDDTFRDRYPPLLAAMLTNQGAMVTGIDSRPNPTATYDHRVADLADPQWMHQATAPFDIIVCLSVFNAPESVFQEDPSACLQLMTQMRSLLSQDGMLIATLPESVFAHVPFAQWSKRARTYLQPLGYSLLHCGRHCVWAQR